LPHLDGRSRTAKSSGIFLDKKKNGLIADEVEGSDGGSYAGHIRAK